MDDLDLESRSIVLETDGLLESQLKVFRLTADWLGIQSMDDQWKGVSSAIRSKVFRLTVD